MKLELDREFTFQKLEINGRVPSWLSGTLFRNGPVLYTIDGKYPVHWFDGFGMLHAFKIDQGNIYYTNKFIDFEGRQNAPNYLGFACDPCHVLFKRIFSIFYEHSIHNANVNIAKFANAFVGLTETPLPVLFDPETLATQGVFQFEDNLAKANVFESAHPHFNTQTGEYLNYIVKYGPTCKYQIYSLYEKTRKLLFEIPISKPAYMHSFSLTENFIILSEYPFRVDPLAMLLSKEPFIKNYKWQEDTPTRFLFVNRNDGTTTTFETDPFFCFHHINAFEAEGKVILDLIAYPDAAIIDTVGKYGQPLFAQAVNQGLAITKVMRFTLSNQKLDRETLYDGPIEFPRINQHYDGKPYCYFYGADVREPETSEDLRPIYKMDVAKKKSLRWTNSGCYPGEPVFIPHPSAKAEDDGLIATVLFNKGQNSSELLLLDASSFEEVARASIPLKMPLGLHGQFYSPVKKSSN